MDHRRRVGELGALCAFTLLANAQAQSATIHPEVLTRDLEHPWALAFIGNGRMLVTERPGRMRVVQPDGSLGLPLQGLPKIDVGGQGGLLDVITDRDFARNRTIYFCYAEPGESSHVNSTALSSARLSEDGKRIEQMKVLFSQKPKVESDAHFGCRIVDFGDGSLFLTLGERYSRKEDAQKLDNHLGKVVRIRKDGSVPPDNPFADRKSSPPGALPEIWSYGHRNSQGATIGPDGKFWMHEHGPQGGDEINRPQAGKNYGWPVITYGENYGGGKIGAGITAKEGMEQPLHYWTPSIAPSGMAFLHSDKYGKAWQGSLFVGSLKFQYLARLEWQGDKVVKEEKLLQNLKQRIRDVREGPDGLLYVLTDERKGQLIRLRPE
ncbi:PQQ-dependent sugar dehydrogenase [Herbaspirillum sp. ST 5-3]|uniref:PQQ-dependent sugar dehydrogenase n=1 Tax=Oxalobacteraceae TaxID=75682 RepID=UPI0010A48C0D|nr:PQQ-dependent sugar dehydrogenase [Herbaspirillum sp. ST 5-3]